MNPTGATMRDEVRKKIEETVSGSKVVLFMKGTKTFPQCGFSARVVQVLKKVGEPFADVNVLADPDIREGIKEFSSWPTIPQLYVNGKFVGGCDIVTELDQNGELAAIVRGS
jgi:monothiol glutaredoxin